MYSPDTVFTVSCLRSGRLSRENIAIIIMTIYGGHNGAPFTIPWLILRLSNIVTGKLCTADRGLCFY